jgi:hypothetical protein
MDDLQTDMRLLLRQNELFNAFRDESIETIWCFELDKPVLIDLPEYKQIDLICNNAFPKRTLKRMHR